MPPILVLALVLALAGVSPLAAQSDRPRLVVLISIDQARADYLERFRPYFGAGGFATLLEEGLVFAEAHHEHATTYTGPGHAVLGSGIYASSSGVVGNDWFDARLDKDVYCVEDASSRPPFSAKNFGALSLAQRLKARHPAGRVISAALKDRAAILMTGPGTDAAYWLEEKGFVTSTYYRSEPEALSFNAGVEAYVASRPLWNFSLSLPTAAVCPADLPETHGSSRTGPSFPHRISGLKALTQTPYGNELLEAFAERLVDSYALGRNPSGAPDLLALSFSSPDYIGHIYGPDSCEVADTYARLDATLARLLAFLRERLAPRDMLVVLSSDHGVARIPAIVRGEGVDAGVLDLWNKPAPDIAGMAPWRRQLELEAARHFGYVLPSTAPVSEAVVRAFQDPSLYLNRAALKRRRLPLAVVRDWLQSSLRSLPGVERVYSREEIERGRAPAVVRRAYRRDRSGDLLVFLKPNWIFSDYPDGTSHGQYQPYDTHVPLILWGRVKAGLVPQRVAVARVAPTLARMLGLSREGLSAPLPVPAEK